METHSDSQPTMLVVRTVDTLETLARSGTAMTLTDLAEAVSTPKATMHRVLQSLQSRGYVNQDGENGRYSAGIRCFELGSMWAHNLDMRPISAPYLSQLNEETMETVHLAVYEHGDVVYIDKYESPQQVIAKSYVGRRCPATCVATGRVLLAFSSRHEISRVLAEPLPAYTSKSVTDTKLLGEMLEGIRAEGVGENHGSYREEVGGISAPIRDHTGQVVAAVGLCLPEHRFTASRSGFLRDRTIKAAIGISAALGGPASLITTGATADHDG